MKAESLPLQGPPCPDPLRPLERKCIFLKPRSVGITTGVAEHLRKKGYCVHENWTRMSVSEKCQKISGKK